MADKVVKGYYQNGDFHQYGKLYDKIGIGIDGAMTQGAVTEQVLPIENRQYSMPCAVPRKMINSSGVLAGNSQAYGATDFMMLEDGQTQLKVISGVWHASTSYCQVYFYTEADESSGLSGERDTSTSTAREITNHTYDVPPGAKYCRFTVKQDAPAVIEIKGSIVKAIDIAKETADAAKETADAAAEDIAEINEEIEQNEIDRLVVEGDAASLFTDNTLDTYQSVGSTTNLYERANANFKHLIINVKVGDTYMLTASGGSYGYSYAVLNASDTILESAKNSSKRTITIPANSTRMVVQYNVNNAFEFYRLTPVNQKIDTNTSNISSMKTVTDNAVVGRTHINKLNPESESIISNAALDLVSVGSPQTTFESDNYDTIVLTSGTDIGVGKVTFRYVRFYTITKADGEAYVRRAQPTESAATTISISNGYKLWLTITKANWYRTICVDGETLPEEYVGYNDVELLYQGNALFDNLKVPGGSIKDGSITSEKYGAGSIPANAIPISTVNQFKWDNILWGKKIVVCGDSFTYGTGAGRIPSSGIYGGKGALQVANWARFIALRNNMTLVNEAIGGSTMAMPLAWINDESATLDDNDLLHIFSYKRYLSSEFNNADYIIIHLGINDGAPNGKLDDTDATFLSDAYSGEDGVNIANVTHADFNFYGAYNKVIRSILTRNPRVKIGIVIAERGTTRIQNAIVNIAIRWGIPYIFQSGDPHISLIGVGERIMTTYHGRLNTSYWTEVKYVNKEDYTASQLNEWSDANTYSSGEQVKYHYFDVATGKNEYVILQSSINANDKKPIVTMSEEAYDIRNRAFDSKYGSASPNDEPGEGGSPYHPNYYGQIYLSTVYEAFLRSL